MAPKYLILLEAVCLEELVRVAMRVECPRMTGRVRLYSVYVRMLSVSWSAHSSVTSRSVEPTDSWKVRGTGVGGVSAHDRACTVFTCECPPSRDQSPVANISITACPSVSRVSTASIVRRACAIYQFRLAGRPLTPSCRIIVSHLFHRSRFSRW